jgi:hypothetical protein
MLHSFRIVDYVGKGNEVLAPEQGDAAIFLNTNHTETHQHVRSIWMKANLEGLSISHWVNADFQEPEALF